jgi:DNA-binding beta-propeller fold protein YncE
MSSCSAAFAWRWPWDVAIDPATHAVYVTSIVDSSLSMIDGTACNAHLHKDCHARSLPTRTGGWPAEIGLDPADGTIYVADNVDAAISLFSMPRH